MARPRDVRGWYGVTVNSKGVARVARDYLNELTGLISAVSETEIENIVEVLDGSLARGARIFVIGNGGSAATASHVVSDLGAGLKRKGLAEFDIMSLADNYATCTAIANDISYDAIFSAQLEGQMTSDDVLVAISASGNSPNIIRAVEAAKKIGATVIGWTGFDGGQLRKLCDLSFHVATPKGAYGVVEDMHLILNHMLVAHYQARSQS